IMLAWGKNFAVLTNLFVDYFPFYDKFRAGSSMLVMAEFTMPLLAILTLYVFIKDASLKEEYKKKVLLLGGGGIIGLLLIFYLFGGSLFGFTTEYDLQIKQQFIERVKEYNPQGYGTWDTLLNNVQKALVQDRIDMFKADTLRTLIFVILTMALMLAYHFKYLKNCVILVLGIGFLAFVDGWQVNKRYLNDDNFVPQMFVENPFPTQLSPRLLESAKENYNLMGIAQKVPFNKS